MIRKYQYITALVLLLIFPISAIGLNFSVHKCKHKGTIQFSFFETSNNNHSDNCCALEDSKNSRKLEHHSEFHEVGKQIEGDACCSSNISVQEMENTESNCESMDAGQQAHTEKNNKSRKENNNSELYYYNSPCCSNSNITYVIDFAFVNIDVKNFLNELSLSSRTFSNETNYVKKYYNYAINDINYPIKEIIYNIITFIHFTSITGDDSDVPYLIFC